MDRREDAKLMKLSDSSDFFSNLGEGLLVEILGRLPNRAVIELKLVCKSWCSLISSQYFITFFHHRRHDPSLPPIPHPSSSSGCFIFQTAHDCGLLVRGGGFHRLDLSFLPCPQSSIRVVGSCADLILCSTRTSTCPMSQTIFYYVCNPLTNQWVALPPAPQFQLKYRRWVAIATGFLCVPAPCSLCTTHNNSPYKFMVVRICIIPVSPIHSQFEFKAQLFLSEEGEWKSLMVSSPRAVRYRVLSSTTLVAYKGLLHWLISGFVLVYDPYNCPQRFSRVIDIDMPADMIAADIGPQTIGLFHDRIRVTYVWGIWLEDPVYYIWELQDYNMGKWSLVHKLRLRTTPRLPDPDLIINLDPKIRETGFSYTNGGTFYWTNSSSSSSSGWWVANGIVHWLTDQWWPTPVPPLTSKIQNNENTLGNS
ncbi:PREDICTED: F-box protein At5g49610-like [Ipomoea nil]|uniref:F-box protein At5g49610-like n=1 Tax=Ipomoea nil TaxID=35883 RepID=UPI0009017595|nr:PREDICTED: F-box protein At5g49610-like [Ipomoea nil]